MKILTERDRETIRSRFLDRMTAIYNVPYHLKESERMGVALNEYMEALNRFSAAELDAGWQRLRNTYVAKSWPSVKECIDACQTAPAVRKTATETQRMSIHEAMQTDLGREALRGRWAASLANHVNEYGCLPDGRDLDRLRNPERKVEVTLRDIKDGQVAAQHLRSIGETMLRREAELARKYSAEKVVL